MFLQHSLLARSSAARCRPQELVDKLPRRTLLASPLSHEQRRKRARSSTRAWEPKVAQRCSQLRDFKNIGTGQVGVVERR